MRRTSAELKRLSREHLNGHWGFAIGANLLVGLLTSAILTPFYFLLVLSGMGMVQMVTYAIATVIVTAVSMILQCGIIRMYFGFARNQESAIGMMFSEFTRRPERYILGFLFLVCVEVICMLPGAICLSVGITTGIVLAAIIGVILYLAGMVALVLIALRMSQMFMLMVDHSDMGVMEAYHRSVEMMEGNKGRYFYINLSFIGLSLLGMLSCGIGMLWVTPYMMQTSVNFYRELNGELDQEQGSGVFWNGQEYMPNKEQ